MSSNYIKTVVEPREAALKAQAVSHTTTIVKTVPTVSINAYMLYIFDHESGNDPKRWNSSGCVGLGQACPASKLLAACPSLDYDCEVNWFTSYANKYGGWAGAYAFWVAHHWW